MLRTRETPAKQKLREMKAQLTCNSTTDKLVMQLNQIMSKTSGALRQYETVSKYDEPFRTHQATISQVFESLLDSENQGHAEESQILFYKSSYDYVEDRFKQEPKYLEIGCIQDMSFDDCCAPLKNRYMAGYKWGRKHQEYRLGYHLTTLSLQVILTAGLFYNDQPIGRRMELTLGIAGYHLWKVEISDSRENLSYYSFTNYLENQQIVIPQQIPIDYYVWVPGFHDRWILNSGHSEEVDQEFYRVDADARERGIVIRQPEPYY